MIATCSAILYVASLGYDWRLLETRRFSHVVRPKFVLSHIIHAIHAVRLHLDSYRQHVRSVVPAMQGAGSEQRLCSASLKTPCAVAGTGRRHCFKTERLPPRCWPCATETMHKAYFDVSTACAIFFAREPCMMPLRRLAGAVRCTGG